MCNMHACADLVDCNASIVWIICLQTGALGTFSLCNLRINDASRNRVHDTTIYAYFHIRVRISLGTPGNDSNLNRFAVVQLASMLDQVRVMLLVGPNLDWGLVHLG
jgi:hypothetical protein